jgi:hypothetical protein
VPPHLALLFLFFSFFIPFWMGLDFELRASDLQAWFWFSTSEPHP